jgi:hydroxymethylpyrimidine pyrophosphatase-like HAD family hydrolase
MNKQKQKYPPPRVIAIDVDDTLFSRGQLNEPLVGWIKEKAAAGYEVFIWSSRGTAYARESAAKAGLSDIIAAALSKPGYIVDDQGWNWIRYTRVVQPTGTAWPKGKR